MPCSLLCYVKGILVGGNDIMLLHTYCRVGLLQGGPYCRVGPTAGWALLQSGQWCPKISSFPGPSSHKKSIQNTSYYDPKLKFISSP